MTLMGQPEKKNAHAPPPSGLGICMTCIKWRAVDAQKVIATPQGNRRVADQIKAGIPVDSMDIMLVSHCTDPASWVLVTSDHWCWQYVPVPR